MRRITVLLVISLFSIIFHLSFIYIFYYYHEVPHRPVNVRNGNFSAEVSNKANQPVSLLVFYLLFIRRLYVMKIEIIRLYYVHRYIFILYILPTLVTALTKRGQLFYSIIVESRVR